MSIIVDYFFFQICSNFLKMKRTGVVVAKSKKFFFNLQTHWKTAFPLPVSRQTNDNLGDFFHFFFKFSWQKKSWWNLTWIWAGNGTQNLTFFSQFVRIFKVSSLDFSSFHGILPQNLKNKPFFSWKRIFFFKISSLSSNER